MRGLPRVESPPVIRPEHWRLEHITALAVLEELPMVVEHLLAHMLVVERYELRPARRAANRSRSNTGREQSCRKVCRAYPAFQNGTGS